MTTFLMTIQSRFVYTCISITKYKIVMVGYDVNTMLPPGNRMFLSYYVIRGLQYHVEVIIDQNFIVTRFSFFL